MNALDAELTAYRREREQLESTHPGKWVLFKGAALISVHDTFEATAEDAVRRYGRGPYLIRQVGAPPMVIPASIYYQPAHEDG